MVCVFSTDPLDLLSVRQAQVITHTPVLVRKPACNESTPQLLHTSPSFGHVTGRTLDALRRTYRRVPGLPSPARPRWPGGPRSVLEASDSASSSPFFLAEREERHEHLDFICEEPGFRLAAACLHTPLRRPWENSVARENQLKLLKRLWWRTMSQYGRCYREALNTWIRPFERP